MNTSEEKVPNPVIGTQGYTRLGAALIENGDCLEARRYIEQGIEIAPAEDKDLNRLLVEAIAGTDPRHRSEPPTRKEFKFLEELGTGSFVTVLVAQCMPLSRCLPRCLPLPLCLIVCLLFYLCHSVSLFTSATQSLPGHSALFLHPPMAVVALEG